MWRRMEPTHESSCWPTTTRNDVPTTPHTQSATKKISIYNSTTVSSSRYVSIFCWWHWRTLHLMRAPYFVDDTYGHCIWSESTIWSLDFRISSSRSPHTFCRANQHVVGWLEDSGFSSPPGLKSRCSHLSCVNFSIFRWCTFSGRRHSTQLRGTYGDFVKSQDHIVRTGFFGILILQKMALVLTSPRITVSWWGTNLIQEFQAKYKICSTRPLWPMSTTIGF